VIDEQKKSMLEWFAKGRNLYKLMKFAEAQECFARALKVDPKDGPSTLYYKRCSVYIKNPPPDDWDGVFVMTSK
jgi:tetratricopeptide (TPR) repeat protein